MTVYADPAFAEDPWNLEDLNRLNLGQQKLHAQQIYREHCGPLDDLPDESQELRQDFLRRRIQSAIRSIRDMQYVPDEVQALCLYYAADDLIRYGNPKDYVLAQACLDESQALTKPGTPFSDNVFSIKLLQEGMLASKRNSPEEAQVLFQRSIAIAQRCDDQDIAVMGTAHKELGGIYLTLGNLANAEQETARALRILDSIPEHPDIREILASTLGQLAGLLISQNRSHEAYTYLQRAERMHDELYEEQDLRQFEFHTFIMESSALGGDFDQMQRQFNRFYYGIPILDRDFIIPGLIDAWLREDTRAVRAYSEWCDSMPQELWSLFGRETLAKELTALSVRYRSFNNYQAAKTLNPLIEFL